MGFTAVQILKENISEFEDRIMESKPQRKKQTKMNKQKTVPSDPVFCI